MVGLHFAPGVVEEVVQNFVDLGVGDNVQEVGVVHDLGKDQDQGVVEDHDFERDHGQEVEGDLTSGMVRVVEDLEQEKDILLKNTCRLN